MKKKTVLLVVVLVSCLMTALAVYAQEAQEAQSKGEVSEVTKGDKFFDQLNITPEQKQKLKENRQAQRQKMQEVNASLKEKRKDLQEALKDPSATRVSVQGIVDEIKTIQARQTDLRLDGIFSVKDILTVQQYAQFQQLMQTKAGEMRKAGKGYQRCAEK
jgi:Spy/CpxP family protein refolding chaperone